jgi:sugar phosphate isomerase/epimerase
VFGSGGSRRIPDGFEKEKARAQFIQLNRRLGTLAEKYAVTIVLEPLNYGETNLLNTVEEGLAMAIEVNHPQVKLLADIFHMLRNSEPPDGIVKAGEWLKHVHIAEKEKRTAPGVAGDDFRPYFQALRKIHYRGRIAIEAFAWGDKEKELPIALQELRKQIG